MLLLARLSPALHSRECAQSAGGGTKKGSSTDALKIYERIRRDGATPSVPITLAALKLCSSSRYLEAGRTIHRELSDSREMANIFVVNTLIDMYAKCGSVGEARQLFEITATARSSTVVSWNAIIAGYADCGEPRVALELFQRMLDEGFRPDGRTFVAALRACAILALEEEDRQIGEDNVKSKLLERGMALHSQACCYGLESNVYVANTLVDMYGKCSSMADARRVFDRSCHCVISWNTLMMGYAESGDGQEALDLFQRMESEGFRPDGRSYTAAIKACASFASREDGKLLEVVDGSTSSEGGTKIKDGNNDGSTEIQDNSDGSSRMTEDGSTKLKIAGRTTRVFKAGALERGFYLHARAAGDGFQSSVFVANALIEMYGKCGTAADARRIFDAMVDRNVVTWATMVLAYAENGDAGLALRLFRTMREDAGLVPDSGAYIAALKACGALADLERGRKLHEEIAARDDLAAHSILETCVLDFYAKCGSMGEARRVFDSMPRRDLVAWNALIAGYADQGDFDRCFQLFDDMGAKNSGVRPDGVTFLSILSACGHAGLVDRARFYFALMRSPRFGVDPSVEHYNCMVDVLGRANQLGEAMAMVEEMPHGGNVRLWTSLLSSCRKWGNVRVGKIAFEALLALDDRGSPAYVLMANSYENDGFLGFLSRN
ncbi:pentatricopeptide repeat-containing protein At5g16860-like [Selaginella moellendorffii]|uniref:pentatricopeptide repeat-containing protein At5g16860-like n=1 Tax=Selaginella moellendorffii TaxID=88036 RepID=UPI000D1C6239|nr:pentatricopeptide repeat-containing protein At5g16860-like [Selaginella moellendorffii]|eukprot:XP_024523683.1 pentatricopeptide repeat-containing protein At5g16860-like [Selaginella moellendorffii]